LFSKNVYYDTTTEKYEFDFIQFNIDYAIEDYDLGNNSNLKIYVYFKYLSDGSYVDPASLTTNLLNRERSVSAGSEWTTTKYQIQNGYIIKPPAAYLDSGKTINDLSFNIIIESKNNTIISSPIEIKTMQLCSFATDYVQQKFKNGISTKFGQKIYPSNYVVPSNYYDYKNKRNYLISKDSNPYLYLTKDSGITLTEFTENYSNYEDSIMIPINENLEADYNLNVIQMFI
jgi:hypothetical protein